MHVLTKRFGSLRNPALEDDNPTRLERMPLESGKQERKGAEKETRRANAVQGSNRALLVLVITMCLISLAVLLLALLMMFGKIGNGCGCSKDEASSTKSAEQSSLEENNTNFQLELIQRLDEFKQEEDARYNDLREDLNMTRSEMLLMTDNVTLTSKLEYHDTVLSQMNMMKSALTKTDTDLAELKSTQTKENVIYHQTMTPSWLMAHALYINNQHSSTPEQVTFNVSSVDNTALLKVPLFPANVLQNSSMLTVRIVVSNDVSIGKKWDSDIRYGLSDGMSFVGFEAVDTETYTRGYSPCFGIEGSSGSRLTRVNEIGPKLGTASDTFYPGRFVITLKLDERENWGSCYTAHDGGFLKTTSYNNRLMASRGLTLEVYRDHKKERYGIKFIEVTIVDDL